MQYEKLNNTLSCLNLGESYYFNEKFIEKISKIKRLKIGQKLFIKKDNNNLIDKKNWVELMKKTEGKYGIIKYINKFYGIILLKLFYPKSLTTEEWWYSIK